MNKTLISIVILAVVLGAAGFLISGVKQMPASDGSPQTQQSSDTQTGGRVADPQIAWTLTDAGETDNIPYTNVSVTLYGTAHALGKYQGSCKEVGASGGIDGTGLLAGELSAVQCYFAGGGDEIGVFANEGGGLDVMAGQLGEGDAENAPFRGNFKGLFIVN